MLLPFCLLCQRKGYSFFPRRCKCLDELVKGNDVQNIPIYPSTSSVNMLFSLFCFPNRLSFTWNNLLLPLSLSFLCMLPGWECKSASLLQFLWHFCWNMKNWVSGILSRDCTWSRSFNAYEKDMQRIFFSLFLTPVLWDKGLTDFVLRGKTYEGKKEELEWNDKIELWLVLKFLVFCCISMGWILSYNYQWYKGIEMEENESHMLFV